MSKVKSSVSPKNAPCAGASLKKSLRRRGFIAIRLFLPYSTGSKTFIPETQQCIIVHCLGNDEVVCFFQQSLVAGNIFQKCGIAMKTVKILVKEKDQPCRPLLVFRIPNIFAQQQVSTARRAKVQRVKNRSCPITVFRITIF